MYACKLCHDVQFCGDCLRIVQENRLVRFICHPEHSWLYIPLWDDDGAAGKGNVKVMDELGRWREVEIKDWLKDLKQVWGL